MRQNTWEEVELDIIVRVSSARTTVPVLVERSRTSEKFDVLIIRHPKADWLCINAGFWVSLSLYYSDR